MKAFVYDKKKSLLVAVLKDVKLSEFDKDTRYLTLVSTNGGTYLYDIRKYKVTLYQN